MKYTVRIVTVAASLTMASVMAGIGLGNLSLVDENRGDTGNGTFMVESSNLGFGDAYKKKPPANKRVIEVVDKVSWSAKPAVDWLDKYTASDMRLVSKCSGKAYSCITIRQGRVSGDRIAYTKNRVITIDISKAHGKRYGSYYRNKSKRTWLIAHELGHTFALAHRGGSNLMNGNVRYGKLALTSGQRSHLRKR